MLRRTVLRLAGIVLVVDGLLAGSFGKAYLHPWLNAGGPLAALTAVVLRWPGRLIRLLGLGEAILGLGVVGAAHTRVPEVYHLFARIYDPFLALWYATLARGVNPAIDRAVREHLPPGGSVLDLGVGTGSNIERLRRLGIPFSRYVGVDLSEDMLAQARSKFGYLPNVTLEQRDLLHDPLPDGPFNLAISTWVFSHLGQGAGEVVARVLRQVKPGGYVVILMYSRPHSWLDPLADALGGIVLAEPVPREVYTAFPRIVTSQRLMGGMATLLIINTEQAQSEGEDRERGYV
ncbi:MAG: class I SAM-dependent DNA methyltransferase [Chloroflexota bacterium]